MITRTIITEAASVRSYFEEAINAAVATRARRTDAATAAYLVDLLCQYALSTDSQLDQPLVSVLAKAVTSLTARSIEQLKQVGDQSLVVAGYFFESLQRADLDRGYYVALGETAYLRLSRVLGIQGDGTRLVVVFSELGQRFDRFVDVLSHVRQRGPMPAAR